MAQPTATRLSRRLFQFTSSRPLFTSSATARSFTSSTSFGRAPSLSDISSSNGPAFATHQKEFRERLRAQKAERDRKPTNLAAAASNSEEVASEHARQVEQALNSPTILGEAREAARAAHHGEPSISENGQKEKRRQGMVSRLIHGTEEGRLHEKELEQSFSQVLARGKYVHSITFHKVKPDKVDEYTQLVGTFYPQAAQDQRNHVKLVGSWRTEVGDCDTFGKSSRNSYPKEGPRTRCNVLTRSACSSHMGV